MEARQPIIVYVEDDSPSILVMKMIMEKVMGVKTLYILQSNANFMHRVEEIGTPPDIFLLDIQIRPYNGFELMNMLRSAPRYSGSKIIALTASVMNEEVERLKQSGFDGAIAKPLDVNVFPGLIDQIMDGESVWFIV